MTERDSTTDHPTASRHTAARRLRASLCLGTVFAMVAVLIPVSALAAGSPLVSETFAGNSTPSGQWYLPPAQSGWTNNACLTAGPVVGTSSVPNCASPPDASGAGALRLTNNGASQVGAVFYQASLPTSEGLDITFDTYQYNGTGADGIAFTLAAANPSDETMKSFLAELLSYPGVPSRWRMLDLDGAPPPFLTINYRWKKSTLRLFSALTTFGTALDIALQELRIESFFPADEATRVVLTS